MTNSKRNSGPPQAEVRLSPEMVRFVESMGLFYESYSVPRIGGRILGLLLLVSEPLTAEQIATTLRISRGSVSTNLRTLGMLNLVDQTTFPGDRRDFFVFSPSAWDRATQARIQGMQGLQAIAHQGLAALPTDDPARRNVEGLVRWTERMIASDRRALAEWQADKQTLDDI
ncbi:MAG: ArsR family transcriptional regulator [Anaerolineae bacterium]|nr:ArsR family transcriptional regulator [Anaerolineae bacterium]